MKNSNSQTARRWATSLLLAPLFLVGQACTDLTETPHDALTPDNAFKTDAELLAGVAGVYAQLRSMGGNGDFTSMEDLTADVSIVPTRGSDWFDNGQWLDMHRQTFNSNSPGTGGFLVGGWNNPFSGIAKANLMIDVVDKSTSASKAKTLAELKTLRAWYYYVLMDQFGGVPLVTGTALERKARSTRAEIFNFIESDLKAALPDLPASWPADGYGRVTKSVANSILAALYLNAGVFTKECATGAAGCSAGFSPTSYNSCNITVNGQNACDAAIAAASAVIADPNLTLEPAGSWKKNFSLDNNSSTENIFVIVYTSEGTAGLGSDWPMRTLHYNQLNTGWGSPWNGFATLAETYNKFSSTDERRNMWLQGQAKSFETGANVNDRTGSPLIFTVSIPDATQATEGTGVRFNKYPPLPSAATGSGMPNDLVLFRLSEMYLIRAEAKNEKGDPTALADLQAIHNLRDPSNPIAPAVGTPMRDAILNERLFEFAGEGKRRTDLIRYGQYTTWTEASKGGVCDPGNSGTVTCTARNARVTLYPIPDAVIGANSLLVQNPGY
ncbi:MAG TPA: RagB/SusD family nutrient uptake outer membrane protein [Gemmatimonadaceae bacterium]|nr:RagB/SusD family nutrient uptake outer membrane protein [Gemmatimonadaceae bacterium]